MSKDANILGFVLNMIWQSWRPKGVFLRAGNRSKPFAISVLENEKQQETCSRCISKETVAAGLDCVWRADENSGRGK